MIYLLIVVFYCMFYQLLCVPHSSSSTQFWGSVLPSIFEIRDQNSRGCPLSLFSNRNLGFFVHRGQKSYTMIITTWILACNRMIWLKVLKLVERTSLLL